MFLTVRLPWMVDSIRGAVSGSAPRGTRPFYEHTCPLGAPPLRDTMDAFAIRSAGHAPCEACLYYLFGFFFVEEDLRRVRSPLLRK